MSGQELLTGCNEVWGVKGVSNLRWSDHLGVLTLWSFIVANGAWKFAEASKNWLLVCLISLPGLLYFHYTMSTSCIHVIALFRIEAANRNGLTNPTCTSKECVCIVPADKTAVQPKQISEIVWKASKLSECSCIIDFLHRSINKICYLVTHLFNLFLLCGQPTATQFRCPNPISV